MDGWRKFNFFVLRMASYLEQLSTLSRGSNPFDMRHEKTDVKVFVVVIPKEGWARF